MNTFEGVEVHENPMIGTRSVFEWCGKLVCHSLECLLQMAQGVRWHEERGGCPSWTGGVSELGGRCCCDTEAA